MKLCSTTMTDSKELPSVIIQTPVVEQKVSPVENRKRLYVTVAVASTIITMVVVTGFVLAFHFYAKTTHDILKHKLSFMDKNGKESSEDVEADMTENVAYMKVDRGELGVHHIVHDYNRKISAIKVESEQGTICYLSALNTTASLASSVLDDNSEEESFDEDFVFLTDPSPVTTLSFLAPKVQELCEGHPTHWSHPTCANNAAEEEQDDGEEGAVGRSKRATYQCSAGCCWRVCCQRITYAITWVEGRQRKCQWGCQGFISATKSATYC